MNKVVLVGRMPQSPDRRYTASGKTMTTFSVACNYKDATGSDKTDFVDCVTWDKLAETVAEHLSKGRLIGVEGRLSVRKYTARDGQQRIAYEVVADNVHFLDAKPDKADKADFAALGQEMPR